MLPMQLTTRPTYPNFSQCPKAYLTVYWCKANGRDIHLTGAWLNPSGLILVADRELDLEDTDVIELACNQGRFRWRVVPTARGGSFAVPNGPIREPEFRYEFRTVTRF